jgi:hypothetical protein
MQSKGHNLSKHHIGSLKSYTAQHKLLLSKKNYSTQLHHVNAIRTESGREKKMAQTLRDLLLTPPKGYFVTVHVAGEVISIFHLVIIFFLFFFKFFIFIVV